MKWADSKELYDSDDVRMHQFENDWRRALPLGLIKLVMRFDDDAAADDDGDGVPDEVEEVCEVFWRHREFWPYIFTFFSTQNSGEPTVNKMKLNAWTQFVNESKIVEKKKKGFAKKSDFDTLFIEIDSLGKAAANRSKRGRREAKQSKPGKSPPPQPAAPAPAESKEGSSEAKEGATTDSAAEQSVSKRVAVKAMQGLEQAEEELANAKDNDGDKSLSRIEFIVALLRIAINKYVLSNQTKDVSDALDRLLSEDIAAALGDKIFLPDSFRKSICYTPEVTKVLARNQGTLRLVFNSACRCICRTKTLISLTGWINLLRALDLIAADVTVRDAALMFSWSRMIVIDGVNDTRGVLKEGNIPFEGFLEAICYLSQLKSLPTTEEIVAQYGQGTAPDAGRYMLDLKAGDEQGYNDFVRSTERHIEWGETLPGHFEPIEVRVQHMISVMVAIVERGGKQGSKGQGDGELSEQEVDSWMTMNKVSAVQ